MSTIVYDENGLRKVVDSSNRTSFGGKVDSTGAAIALPAGWTCDYNVTIAGRYYVEHNRGYADGDAYAVVATAVTDGGHANAQVDGQDADSFWIVIFDDENGGITADFNFILLEI